MTLHPLFAAINSVYFPTPLSRVLDAPLSDDSAHAWAEFRLTPEAAAGDQEDAFRVGFDLGRVTR